MIADSIALEGDEGRWVLAVTSTDGERLLIDVHALAIDGTLSTQLASALNAVEGWRDPIEPGPGRPDLDGYDLSDPKRAALENGGTR